MKRSVLTLLTLATIATCAHAQVGQTYRQLVRHFGKGTWNSSDHAYGFNDGPYVITASFGQGHDKYCDLIICSHTNGRAFSQAEVEGLAHRTYTGPWPQFPNSAIAAWSVNADGIVLGAMLFWNKQYRESDPGFTRQCQALVIGTKPAMVTRGYWTTNSDSANNDGTEDQATYY